MNFAGKILLSSPNVNDGIFSNSVIYIHKDNNNGTVGFIINLKMDQTIARTWSKEIDWQFPTLIHHGGPIDAHAGYVLHSNDYTSSNTTEINSSLFYTTGTQVVTDINNHNGPTLFTLLVGFCQWQPQQLANEIARNMWQVVDYVPELFFSDVTGKESWKYAITMHAKQLTDKILNV